MGLINPYIIVPSLIIKVRKRRQNSFDICTPRDRFCYLILCDNVQIHPSLLSMPRWLVWKPLQRARVEQHDTVGQVTGRFRHKVDCWCCQWMRRVQLFDHIIVQGEKTTPLVRPCKWGDHLLASGIGIHGLHHQTPLWDAASDIPLHTIMPII